MMMMMMSGMRVQHVVKQRLRMRIDYIITAHTHCPNCDHVFNPETEQGWSDNPTDCMITCPECGNRFQGQLDVQPREVSGVPQVHQGFFSYLCPSQTLYEMCKLLGSGSRKRLGEKFLHNKHPRIYFSMIKNFGSYQKARAQV